MTHQIFVKDSKQGTVLAMETQSNQGRAAHDNAAGQHGAEPREGRAKKVPFAERNEHLGFKNYREQEELDTASANDLIRSQHKAVIRQQKQQESRPILLADQSFQDLASPPMIRDSSGVNTIDQYSLISGKLMPTQINNCLLYTSDAADE